MDGNENLTDREEKELARNLDECSFLYGEKFTKIAEHPRTIAAAEFSAQNVKNAPAHTEHTESTPAPAENTGTPQRTTAENTGSTPQRTRVHIDLGETKSGKLSPAPEASSKTLTAEKKNKK